MKKISNMQWNNRKKVKPLYKKVVYHEAVSISLLYAAFGMIWIQLSDTAVAAIYPDINEYQDFQTYKGLFYILVTTIVLYFLIRNRIKRLKNQMNKTELTYEKLCVAHADLIRTENELIYQKELTDNIIQNAPVIIVTHDLYKISSINPYTRKLCGYEGKELKLDNMLDSFVPKEYRDNLHSVLHDIKKEKQFKSYESPIMTEEGKLINILWTTSLLNTTGDNQKDSFVSFGTDIEERKRYEEKVEHMAFYDSLTGLANRIKFEIEINKYLKLDRLEAGFMIAYIDIDNFKTINDSMGHQIGDLFLTYFGECLKSEVVEPNIVARLGGDEFAIMYFGLSRDDIIGKIDAIQKRISKSWTIENHQFYISMSVGVVTYPFDGISADTLLKNADIAMYSAKSEGKNRIVFYKEDIQENNSRRIKMINNLQYGIDEEQFTLNYQPQYELSTGKMIGAEVLVRWIHPVEGFISPAEFIPLAEDSGQIYRLERWIIRKALEQKKRWELDGYEDMRLSINLSVKTLTSNINFDELDQIISSMDVDFSRVIIEITETANIQDVECVISNLNRLKRKGIKIALDDFGTGYSSLNYLKKFPIDIVKLDRSFIGAIHEKGVDTLLIKNILSLAHDLNFIVVAEGIETQEQVKYLRKHECEEGQGYLLSRPLTEEKMNILLSEKHSFPVNWD
ncbi:MAG: bifunctional diguanylate cyclase/phosphodiesterase [Mobilitalea sp.]